MNDKIFFSTKESNKKLCIVQDNLAYILKNQGDLEQMPKTTYFPPYAITTINGENFNFSDIDIKEKFMQVIGFSDEVNIYSDPEDGTVLTCKVKLFESN